MPNLSKTALRRLCEQLEVEDHFFLACLEESVVDVDEVKGRIALAHGSVFRLRRLQRICLTFGVDVPLARMLMR